MLPPIFLALLFSGLVAVSRSMQAKQPMQPLTFPIEAAYDEPSLVFSTKWQILGPFRLGTREAIWGSDPLERYGGFRNVPYEVHAKFESSLGSNGSVSWTNVHAISSARGSCASTELHVDFPDQDWLFARSVYGWAGLQYQGWARGFVTVTGLSEQKILLFTDNILEFWVNDEQIVGGDFYGFRRAPLILTLLPGDHTVNIRLVRDVRAMGASEQPSIAVTLEACIRPPTLLFSETSVIVSDLVEGKLPSPFASIDVSNVGGYWIEVLNCTGVEGFDTVEMLGRRAIRLAPGQTRRIGVKLNIYKMGRPELAVKFEYKMLTGHNPSSSQVLHFIFTSRKIREPHKMTFLHPSGAVSYAIVRAPNLALTGQKHEYQNPLPVLLNLHGAGLEADSHQVRHMMDAVPDLNAWVVLPTGMSPWSGDDWHTWGFADVSAAVSAISDWIRNMDWTGPGVLLDNWLVSGHSNGGQGTWYILSHKPDVVIAAAAASGYLSIQNYVPYQMWREAPPLLTAALQNSMTSFRHELLVDNFAGIPIIQQHGSADDNVPPYHSRLMSSLLSETGFPSDYNEILDKGHWWEGAMTTEPLQAFYLRHLKYTNGVLSPPDRFHIVHPGSGDMCGRWGIIIDQVQSPDNVGKISVHRDIEQDVWHLKTSNVRRLHFDFSRLSPPAGIMMENCNTLYPLKENPLENGWFEKSASGLWTLTDDKAWKNLQARYGRQKGAMDAIMRTSNTFKIVMCSENTFEVALQISRNLFQYFAADSTIVDCKNEHTRGAGNIITIAIREELPSAQLGNFPISISNDGIELRTSGTDFPKNIHGETGLGAVYLRPLEEERLELVVWGFDQVGLRQASRLVPTLTGVGQADFIVLGDEARWKGHAGALAMGFFDHEWRISRGSYVP